MRKRKLFTSRNEKEKVVREKLDSSLTKIFGEKTAFRMMEDIKKRTYQISEAAESATQTE